ncbi:MAG: DinB family protein [Gemmatimonadota bacterium]|nr:DinB family protein [Gemmatimonadota bacterium]
MSLSLAEILDQVDLSGHQFLACFQGVSDEAWRRKPDPAAWSMEEIAEHVAIVEAQVRKLILERMVTAPATAELLAECAGKDELIERRMADPAGRPAPESTQPRGRWATPAELAQSFRGNRQRVLDFMRSSTVDSETHGWEHPAFGALTLRQWLFSQARHVERHTVQMHRLAHSLQD